MKRLYTVREGNKNVAIADVSPWDDDKRFCVDRIKVFSAFRGRGYGSQLLREVSVDADKEGVWLLLETHSYGGLNAEQLIAWYRRYGFLDSDKFY
jgi:ribosomal protein S18 acetylase RimI-like enzyme